ncbi:MAG TPA: class I SAM-dependent methyltransferase [Polyangia bacterium]
MTATMRSRRRIFAGAARRAWLVVGLGLGLCAAAHATAPPPAAGTAGAGGATGAATDEAVWKDFIEWLPSAPVSQTPQPIFDLYRQRLVGKGATSAEAERRLGVVLGGMRARTDGWRVMFNKIYTAPNGGFSTEPSALLVGAVSDRAPGRALDVGAGQGRNSVFLAMRGWNVTGFDISDEGLRVAQQNAKKAGVKIATVVQSLQSFDMGRGQWDLIVLTYEPAPVASKDYVQKLATALRPGGLVVVESFASDAGAKQRRPVDIDPQEMLRAFSGVADFRVLRFEDVVGTPEWTRDKTRLTRLVVEKRPP